MRISDWSSDVCSSDLDDVVDVGEVAGVVAVVEHVDRLAGQDLAREQEQRHVRPAPGPVDGEEAQAGGRQVEQVAVGVRHQFVGLLGGRVHAHRVVDRSEEHTSELQSLMRTSYAVFCLKKKKTIKR